MSIFKVHLQWILNCNGTKDKHYSAFFLHRLILPNLELHINEIMQYVIEMYVCAFAHYVRLILVFTCRYYENKKADINIPRHVFCRTHTHITWNVISWS